MKTIYNVLIAATTLLAANLTSANAQQCHTYPVKPVVSRFYHFQMEGRPFAFDQLNGDIFCNNVKIGFRTPDGRINLIPGAAAQLEGAPAVGGVAVSGGVVAQPVGVAGGQQIQGGAPIQGGAAGQSGAPIQGGAVQGGVAPGTNGTPVPAPAQGTPVQGNAPAGGPAPAAPAPVGTAAVAPVGNAIPVLGSGNDPALAQIDPQILAGQWRAEVKGILGESTVSELNFEDKNVTFRVQVQGNEPRVIEGAFDITDGKLAVKSDDENKDLGQIAIENGQLVLKSEGGPVTFKKIEE